MTGSYYKDDPTTKRLANRTRRTVVCSDGVKRRLYPSNPEYVSADLPKGHPMLARIREEQREVFKEGKKTTARYGFVYVVRNPIWPDFVKIGRALDPEDRVNSFQTGDPYRAYQLIFFEYSEDRGRAEAHAHAILAPWRVQGTEWFRLTIREAVEAIRLACAQTHFHDHGSNECGSASPTLKQTAS